MATLLPVQGIDETDNGGFKSLREQIQLAKQQLDHHFQSNHRMLYEKEQALISELDGILVAANVLYEKRRELKQTQGDLEEKIKRNEFKAMKSKLLEVVNVELCELERVMSVSEREVVELEWRDSQLPAAIRESCIVLRRDPTVVNNPISTPTHPIIPYTDRQVPLWNVGIKGSGDGQLDQPRCVAVDRDNEDIYVADKDNDRIAIFDKKGNFIRNISCDGMKWPYAIALTSEFCFVTSAEPKGVLLKLNKKTGKKLFSLEPGVTMFALTLDAETGMLVACPLYKLSIWYIQTDNLEIVLELTLHTPHFTQAITKLEDLKTQNDEIYILFLKSSYPLQSFSRDGNLLRTITPNGFVNIMFFFCIDSQNNFIVSDQTDYKILVFSSTGELMANIGRKNTDKDEPGEICGPRGVAVTEDGRIVVCDGKLKNRLQFF